MPCASAVPGASAMLAVGKPRPVPRFAPPITVPVTRHQWPSISAAPCTSPCASSARMALDENTSPASATCATTVTPKPCAAPGTAQRLGIAGAALAEVEVVADHHVRHVRAACTSTCVDERLGRQPGQRGVEAQHDGEVEHRTPPAARACAAAASAGSAVCRAGRTRADAARTASRRPAAGFGRRIPGGLQQRLVAAMHAVEVADRQRRATGVPAARSRFRAGRSWRAASRQTRRSRAFRSHLSRVLMDRVHAH